MIKNRKRKNLSEIIARLHKEKRQNQNGTQRSEKSNDDSTQTRLTRDSQKKMDSPQMIISENLVQRLGFKSFGQSHFYYNSMC